MYNTLKEIQEGLSEKELDRYAEEALGKNAAEIIEMFNKDGIEISVEAAKECVEELKGIEAVSENELDDIAGGCGSKKPVPKYQVNQHLRFYYNVTQNYRYFTVTSIGEYYENEHSYLYGIKFDNGREDTRFLDKEDNISAA